MLEEKTKELGYKVCVPWGVPWPRMCAGLPLLAAGGHVELWDTCVPGLFPWPSDPAQGVHMRQWLWYSCVCPGGQFPENPVRCVYRPCFLLWEWGPSQGSSRWLKQDGLTPGLVRLFAVTHKAGAHPGIETWLASMGESSSRAARTLGVAKGLTVQSGSR